jgi:hypothetical protein
MSRTLSDIRHLLDPYVVPRYTVSIIPTLLDIHPYLGPRRLMKLFPTHQIAAMWIHRNQGFTTSSRDFC